MINRDKIEDDTVILLVLLLYISMVLLKCTNSPLVIHFPNFAQLNLINCNKTEYDKLYLFGSAPARIYGTLQMHKFLSSNSFPKLHPIVPSIGAFNYNFACFLCELLSPLVSNDYSCKDTFPFVSQINNTNFSRKFLVS